MANAGNKDDDKKPFDAAEMKELNQFAKELMGGWGGMFSDLVRGEAEKPPAGSGQIYVDSEPLGSFSFRRRIDMIGSRHCPYQAGTPAMEDAVSKMIWESAMLVWDHPVNWQLSVTYNVGQATWWFTARFYDEEASEPLVNETVELTEEEIFIEWERIDVLLERMLTKMKEKCDAELAMFE